jgi:hypothetical protein
VEPYKPKCELRFSFFGVLKFGRKNGCLTPSLSNNTIPIDIIEFSRKTSTSIFEKVALLYRQDMSVTDISGETSLSRGSIWDSLRCHKHGLWPQVSEPFERWRQGRGKTGARPPYGYSFFQGEVIKDPVEYPTLQLIKNLLKQGVGISSIVRRLEAKGIKSRMKKPWNYNVIKLTIRRLQDGSTDRPPDLEKKPNKTETKSKGEKMNLDKLFAWVVAVVTAFASTGQINVLEAWVWRLKQR